MRGVVQPPGFDIPLRNKEKEVVAWARCSERHKNEVMKHKWSLREGYANTFFEKKSISLHAFIVKVLEGIEVKNGHVIDHFNPDGGDNNKLDNRIERLRVITVKQNGKNRTKRKDVSSKYHGVSYQEATGKWTSGIKIDGVRHLLGTWDDEIDAAKARDTFILTHASADVSFFKLNFPNETIERLMYVKKRQKTSKYNGVSKKAVSSIARITVGKKQLHLGRDMSQEVCARMYDTAIVKYNMPRRWLNFPDEHPTYVQELSTLLDVVEVDDTTYRIILNNAPDVVALIDKASFEMIRSRKCFMKNGYVDAYDANNNSVPLHRYLMKVSDANILVDHIDNNTFNNRLSNLRLSDHIKNASNRKLSKNASSRYLGVTKRGGGFRSKIRFCNKDLSRQFASESIAAGFRDLFILKKVTGSDMKMNFKWDQQRINEWTAYLLKLGHNFDELELK